MNSKLIWIKVVLLIFILLLAGCTKNAATEQVHPQLSESAAGLEQVAAQKLEPMQEFEAGTGNQETIPAEPPEPVYEWCSLNDCYDRLKARSDQTNQEIQSFLESEMLGKRIDSNHVYRWNSSITRKFERTGQICVAAHEGLVIIWYAKFVGKDETSFVHICEDIEVLQFSPLQRFFMTEVNNYFPQTVATCCTPIGIKLLDNGEPLPVDQVYTADYAVSFDFESDRVVVTENTEKYKIANIE